MSRSSNVLLWTRPVVPPLLPPEGLFTPAYWDRGEDCSVFNDKPWLAVDASGGPHDGRVHVAWSRFEISHRKYKESPLEGATVMAVAVRDIKRELKTD